MRKILERAKKKQPRDARGRYAAFSPSTPQADDSESPENEQADGSGVGTIAEQTSSTNLPANDPPLIVPVVRRDTSTQHEEQQSASNGSTGHGSPTSQNAAEDQMKHLNAKFDALMKRDEERNKQMDEMAKELEALRSQQLVSQSQYAASQPDPELLVEAVAAGVAAATEKIATTFAEATASRNVVKDLASLSSNSAYKMQALVLQDGESIENDLRIDEHLILISSNLQARGGARGLKVASFWKNAATKVYKRIRSRQKGPLRNAEHATEDDLISDDPEVEALSLNLGGDMIGFLPKKAKEYADQRAAQRNKDNADDGELRIGARFIDALVYVFRTYKSHDVNSYENLREEFMNTTMPPATKRGRGEWIGFLLDLETKMNRLERLKIIVPEDSYTGLAKRLRDEAEKAIFTSGVYDECKPFRLVHTMKALDWNQQYGEKERLVLADFKEIFIWHKDNLNYYFAKDAEQLSKEEPPKDPPKDPNKIHEAPIKPEKGRGKGDFGGYPRKDARVDATSQREGQHRDKTTKNELKDYLATRPCNKMSYCGKCPFKNGCWMSHDENLCKATATTECSHGSACKNIGKFSKSPFDGKLIPVCPYLHNGVRQEPKADVNAHSIALDSPASSIGKDIVDGSNAACTHDDNAIEVESTADVEVHQLSSDVYPYKTDKHQMWGILDNASEVHTSKNIQQEIGSVQINTSVASKTCKSGLASTPVGDRTTVQTNKNILSIPVLKGDDDIIGYSDFKELPDQLVIGATAIYKKKSGPIALPTSRGVPQVPVDLEAARLDMLDGLTKNIIEAPSDSCSHVMQTGANLSSCFHCGGLDHTTHDCLNITELEDGGICNFAELPQRARNIFVRHLKEKTDLAENFSCPDFLWSQSKQFSQPPLASEFYRAIDAVVDQKWGIFHTREVFGNQTTKCGCKGRVIRFLWKSPDVHQNEVVDIVKQTDPLVHFSVDNISVSPDTSEWLQWTKCWVKLRDVEYAEDETFKKIVSIAENSSTANCDLNESIDDLKASPSNDELRIQAQKMSDHRVQSAQERQAARDSASQKEADFQAWVEKQFGSGLSEKQVRRKCREYHCKQLTDKLSSEEVEAIRYGGSHDEFEVANLKRLSKDGSWDKRYFARWAGDLIPITPAGSRGETAISFWTDELTGEPGGACTKDKTQQAAFEGIERKAAEVGYYPSEATGDADRSFIGAEFLKACAREGIRYDDPPGFAQHLNAAEPRYGDVKSHMRTIMTCEHRPPSNEWPSVFEYTCTVKSLLNGCIRRTRGPKVEEKMLENLAPFMTLVLVQDEATSGSPTFSSKGVRAGLQNVKSVGIMYCQWEMTAGGEKRLSVPKCSRNFVIKRGEYYLPKQSSPSTFSFGDVVGGNELPVRKRGRPKKLIVNVNFHENEEDSAWKRERLAKLLEISETDFETSEDEVAFYPPEVPRAFFEGLGSKDYAAAADCDAIISLTRKEAFKDEPWPVDPASTYRDKFTEAAEKEKRDVFDATQSFKYETTQPTAFWRRWGKEKGIVIVYCRFHTIWNIKNAEYLDATPKVCEAAGVDPKAKARTVCGQELDLSNGQKTLGLLPGEKFVAKTPTVAVQNLHLSVGIASGHEIWKRDETGAFPTVKAGGPLTIGTPPPNYFPKAVVEHWKEKGFAEKDLACVCEQANYGRYRAGFVYQDHMHNVKLDLNFCSPCRGLYVRTDSLSTASHSVCPEKLRFGKTSIVSHVDDDTLSSSNNENLANEIRNHRQGVGDSIDILEPNSGRPINILGPEYRSYIFTEEEVGIPPYGRDHTISLLVVQQEALAQSIVNECKEIGLPLRKVRSPIPADFKLPAPEDSGACNGKFSDYARQINGSLLFLRAHAFDLHFALAVSMIGSLLTRWCEKADELLIYAISWLQDNVSLQKVFVLSSRELHEKKLALVCEGDLSFCPHYDGSSQGAHIICIRGRYSYLCMSVSSQKLKLACTSSGEGETKNALKATRSLSRIALDFSAIAGFFLPEILVLDASTALSNMQKYGELLAYISRHHKCNLRSLAEFWSDDARHTLHKKGTEITADAITKPMSATAFRERTKNLPYKL